MGSSDQLDEVLVRPIKAYEGDEIHSFLTSVIDGDEWPLYLRGYSPCHPLNARLGGLQIWWGLFEKRKVPFLCRESDHNHPVVQPVSQ
jgi:hypothetical protein